MKNILILLGILFIALNSHGQFPPRQIAIKLTPIMRENRWLYYYDGNVVPFPALMLPMLTLNDRQINRNIMAMRTLRDVGRPLVMAGVIYWFYNSGNPQYIINHVQRFVGLAIGTTVFAWASVITNEIRERRIINRYNEIVFHTGDSLNSRQVTLSLMPIERKNGKIFFDGYRVKYENLTLPLRAVQDKQINSGMRAIQAINRTRRLVMVLPLLYFYYTLSNPKGAIGNVQTIRTASIGIISLGEVFNLTNAIIKRRIIDRYNKVVLLPSVSLNPHGANFGVSMGF